MLIDSFYPARGVKIGVADTSTSPPELVLFSIKKVADIAKVPEMIGTDYSNDRVWRRRRRNSAGGSCLGIVRSLPHSSGETHFRFGLYRSGM